MTMCLSKHTAAIFRGLKRHKACHVIGTLTIAMTSLLHGAAQAGSSSRSHQTPAPLSQNHQEQKASGEDRPLTLSDDPSQGAEASAPPPSDGMAGDTAAPLADPSSADIPEGQSTESSNASASAPNEPRIAPSEPKSDLDKAIQFLDEFDLEQADAALKRATTKTGYTLKEVETLFETIGIVKAYLDDEEAAREAFSMLLSVSPAYTISYGTSPKATFLFEKVRDEKRLQRAIDVTVELDRPAQFDQPIRLKVTKTSDPQNLIDDAQLYYRLKGELEFNVLHVDWPNDGSNMLLVELPSIPSQSAAQTQDGVPHAIIQVALSGHNALQWEVFEGPIKARPLEIPVGYDPPQPWYSQWWVWSVSGSLVAFAVTSMAAGAGVYFLWPAPETVPLTVEVHGS